MAKKQNMKDRLAESRGMERYETERKMGKKKKKSSSKKRFHFGEDHSAPSNMPQHLVSKAYPVSGYSLDEYYPDDLAGVDQQIDDDARTVMRNARRGGDKY